MTVLPSTRSSRRTGESNPNVLNSARIRTTATVVALLVAAVLSGWVISLAGRAAAEIVPAGVPAGRLAVLTGVTILAILVVAAARKPATSAVAGLVAIPAISVWPVLVQLRGTKHWLAGLHGDQLFRTALMEKMRAGEFSADMYYEPIAGFYPQLWFWLGGAFAGDVPAFEYYRQWATVTMAVIAGIAYLVWAAVLRNARTALVPATITALVGATIGADEPYGWVIIALLPPFAIWVARVLRSDRARPALAGLGIGAGVGLSADVYTLVAGLTGVVVGVISLHTLWKRQITLRRLTGTALWALLTAALVMAPVWGPYLLDPRTVGPNWSAHFLPEPGAVLPNLLTGYGLLGVAALGGVAALVVLWNTHPDIQPVGVVAAVAVAWFPLSGLVHLVAGSNLLAFRMIPVLVLSLSVAGAFGMVHLYTRFPGVGKAPATVLLVVLTVGAGQTVTTDRQKLLDLTYLNDTSHVAVDLAEGIIEATGRPPEETTVLSSQTQLASVAPLNVMQAPVQAYSNPKADLPARAEGVRYLSESRTSDELLGRMSELAEQGMPVDALVLDSNNAISVPAGHGNRVAVTFNPALFSTGWESETVGNYTWYVPSVASQ